MSTTKKGNKMGKLELALLVGAESKEWLSNLSSELDRAEKILGKGAKAKASREAVEEEENEEEEEQDDFASKSKRGKAKKAASFDDDDSAEEENEDESDDASEEESDDIDVGSLKKGKAKKLTGDDVNDACKAKAAESSRSEVLAILKKKFKVKSISDLEPSQYAAVIKAMEV